MRGKYNCSVEDNVRMVHHFIMHRMLNKASYMAEPAPNYGTNKNRQHSRVISSTTGDRVQK